MADKNKILTIQIQSYGGDGGLSHSHVTFWALSDGPAIMAISASDGPVITIYNTCFAGIYFRFLTKKHLSLNDCGVCSMTATKKMNKCKIGHIHMVLDSITSVS